MTCLGSKDTTTEIIFDTNTLSTACNIWSAPALNGILWPFSSDSTPELHERSEKALISFVCSDEATLSTSDFLTKFEQLLDKFGIEAVLFLTSRRIRETSGNVALGKKCVIRSRFAEPKVEFRIRYLILFSMMHIPAVSICYKLICLIYHSQLPEMVAS
jgi:hypothetical protein